MTEAPLTNSKLTPFDYESWRCSAEKIALHNLGLPYKWGGDDPMAGFDCSGFIIEILKSVGLLPREGDWTAQGLYELFSKYQLPPKRPAQSGVLVFWQNPSSGKIFHVEYCLNGDVSIGAGGGGSRTMTELDAINQNAYIKIRPFKPRGADLFVDPFTAFGDPDGRTYLR